MQQGMVSIDDLSLTSSVMAPKRSVTKFKYRRLMESVSTQCHCACTLGHGGALQPPRAVVSSWPSFLGEFELTVLLSLAWAGLVCDLREQDVIAEDA